MCTRGISCSPTVSKGPAASDPPDPPNKPSDVIFTDCAIASTWLVDGKVIRHTAGGVVNCLVS